MAIVKMKKLRVVAMADHREELLKGLLHLGCVDDKLSDPAWSALLKRETSRLAETKSELADVNTALDAIKRIAQPKDGMFTPRDAVTEGELFSEDAAEHARQVSEHVGGLLQQLTALRAEESRLLAKKATLQPWTPRDRPLERQGTAHTLLRMGVCPASAETVALRS